MTQWFYGRQIDTSLPVSKLEPYHLDALGEHLLMEFGCIIEWKVNGAYRFLKLETENGWYAIRRTTTVQQLIDKLQLIKDNDC